MTARRTNKVRALPVKVVRLPHAQDLPLPQYQTEDAAGLDLIAALPKGDAITLPSGTWALVPTGLILELPSGTEAQVRPRSGLAAKAGVTVLNAPGTIDADYRGEVSVILINHGKEPFLIRRGDRIAQLVLAPVTRARLIEGRTVSQTERGAGGFGSTGVKNKPSQNAGKSRKAIARKSPAAKR